MNTDADVVLGERIRRLREQQGLSLRALAEQSGLSANAISRMERGESSPNVSSLRSLANALGVMISDLFEEDVHPLCVYVKHNLRHRTPVEGAVVESLGIGLPEQRLEPLIYLIDAGSTTATTPIQHAGQEFAFCIDGVVDFRVGQHIYRMEQGDSLLFEANQPHAVYNASPEQARLLIVLGSDGSQGQARAQHIAGLRGEIEGG